jgi:hypothetical protein
MTAEWLVLHHLWWLTEMCKVLVTDNVSQLKSMITFAFLCLQ